jgi:malate synthase
MNTVTDNGRIAIHAPTSPAMAEILTPAAIDFVARLERAFREARRQRLLWRTHCQADLDAACLPDFPGAPADDRDTDWRVAPIAHDLEDRRVEITGPAERKMIINALNSGAQTFMADLEDSTAPTWRNMINGQLNLRDAVRRTIDFEMPGGRAYALDDHVATLMIRPRGWHLLEKHMTVDGDAVSASLFDFGLYFFHNARALLERGSAPYFYLPKLENAREARLWNDVFNMAQDLLAIPRGTIRATVLIETVLAVFEAEDILFELREHSAGLNCGRWDYIFSFIKKFRHRPDCVFPNRADVTMTVPCMDAYARHVVQVCHRRGAHAIGGMAAQIPIKHNPAANDIALDHVRADKTREARAGHDGTWVAHPGLVPVAREAFDACMPQANQIARLNDDAAVSAAELLAVPGGAITEEGLRTNISVALEYLTGWLGGNGCIPLNNLMEDAATAEISRSQVWQWLRHNASMANGRTITPEVVRGMIKEEHTRIAASAGSALDHVMVATTLLEQLTLEADFVDFLTMPAYEYLN